MTSTDEAINLRDWIKARVPAPPPALAQRLDEIVAGTTSPNHNALPDLMIGCAEELLGRIGDDRAAATDLLAADSLVTYAMEAAAGHCLDIDEIAARAATRLASVSSRGEHP